MPDDYRRRWFTDDYFDLFMWYEADGAIHGFQLCYDKPARERALTWTRANGFQHSGIDSGEALFSNLTPILIADRNFPVSKVLREFAQRSSGLEREIEELIRLKIVEYQSSGVS